jgi:2-polyprenyl-6-methoxyphenol hydroxylase-like FAD-dependent oxidoreductase
MPTSTDVVIVGGGIAGASLAYALAREGLGVTVLEATTEFPDRVRGESMQCWGVAEARELGVEQVLLDAGAHISATWNQYMEGSQEPAPIPMNMLVPGVGGTLNLRHPDACQALIDAAAGAGATVVRGASHIELGDGDAPTVRYDVDGVVGELRPGLVVGADGRNSTVRKQVGITLERQEAISYISGLLLEGLEGVPDDFDVLVGEGDRFFLVFHQGGGRARSYICSGLSSQHRFSGPEGTKHFLEACAVESYPWSAQVVAATPAGPCATYPGDDTWTSEPYVDRVVLIGDAAGHNDPVVGQGLSIGMRDARTVRDLALDGARDASAFASYGAERMERMRRLRLIADIIAMIQAEDSDRLAARRELFGEKMASMDPGFFPLVLGAFMGPETIPEELVNESILDEIRAV